MFPPELKTRSDGELVAGMERYFLPPYLHLGSVHDAFPTIPVDFPHYPARGTLSRCSALLLVFAQVKCTKWVQLKELPHFLIKENNS